MKRILSGKLICLKFYIMAIKNILFAEQMSNERSHIC